MAFSQVVLVVSLFLLVTFVCAFLVLLRIKHNKARDLNFQKAVSDPAVRSLVYQLIRNQYTENPSTVEERRSNNRRALAMMRLKKLVHDPSVRASIYRLTDKSRW